MKKLALTIFVTFSSTSILADNLQISNKMTLIKGTGVYKNVKPLWGNIKDIQIKINNVWHDLGELANNVKNKNISINNKDHYSIKLQAVDGKWYHTLSMVYYSKEYKNKAMNIKVEGNTLPLKLTSDSQVLSVFYDDNGWPAIEFGCTTTFLLLDCKFYNSNNVSGFSGKISNFSQDLFKGVAYMDPDLKPQIYAKAKFSSLAYYIQIDWYENNKEQSRIGYGMAGGIGTIGTGEANGQFYRLTGTLLSVN